MKATRFLKRMIGYGLLACVGCGWLIVMIKQSGSSLTVQSILIGLLVCALAFGIFVGFIKLVSWCFDL